MSASMPVAARAATGRMTGRNLRAGASNIGQIARSAEQLGFSGALTPTSSWCEDAWIITAALTEVLEALAIDEFILSGYPHLEETYRVGEGVLPELRRRGLLAVRGSADELVGATR